MDSFTHVLSEFHFFSPLNNTCLRLLRACAYGVEALVEKMVAYGADVNSVNSFGFSCLLEACHRGFINIVRFLVRGPRPVNFTYIPSEMEAMNSPFSSAPCQSALAEAARCGFNKVVQVNPRYIFFTFSYIITYFL